MDRFRSYLLHGDKAEGLEFAMRAGLWGHALFLASKMDQRTYAGVMTRFANGLAINDPLQTLYQLMSARWVVIETKMSTKFPGNFHNHKCFVLPCDLQIDHFKINLFFSCVFVCSLHNNIH